MTSKIRAVPLGRIRLADVDDASEIMKLVTESMSLNFRIKEPADIVYLIQKSVLSICQLDNHETIVGFLAAKDYPFMPAISPVTWEDFVWNKYKAINLNARNTLFLHLICWNPVYSRDVVDRMLKSTFMHDPYLHYIVMMKSFVDHQVLCPGYARCEASFKRIQTLERGVSSDRLPSLWVAERKDVSPRLRIRRAVEEDNDDIIPIIDRHSVRLRELYGDFYISELISRHPESERALLVCEHNDVAVGVMCLNTQINYEALEESYELSPFAGLKRLEGFPAHTLSFISVGDSQFSSNIDIRKHSKDDNSEAAKVVEDSSKIIHREESQNVQTTSVSQLDIVSLLEDEEDELEYDIINIDNSLLKLPWQFTDEFFIKHHKHAKTIVSTEERAETPLQIKVASPFKDRKRKTLSTLYAGQSKVPEPKRHIGAPNAFLLELFAMHPDYDERYGFDMLEAAYELFPDRDYCVTSSPSSYTCFPLLEHFTLVTPLGLGMRFIKECLYVAHVNSVKGDVRVRPAEAFDTNNIELVLQQSPIKSDLVALFQRSISSKLLSSYVLLSQYQPIGLVILGQLEESTSIRNQYDLEPEMQKPNTDGAILAGVMSPVMEPHLRWYLRDLIRQTEYTTLFWICQQFANGDLNPGKNLMSLASHMLPVRPRRYMPNMIDPNKELEKIFKNVEPFALWSIKKPLTSLPKVTINTSIVVVGASGSGLAFLETLLFGPSAAYLTFTNVTLVSKNGLAVQDGIPATETCVPRSTRYTDRYLKSLPFYYYIDIITAVMVKIDRKKKCIHLDDGGVKFYDNLVLTCGRQFQQPNYLKNFLESKIQDGKYCDRILMDDPKYLPDEVLAPSLPFENVMIINSKFEAKICMEKLLWMISVAKETSTPLSHDNPIILYGDCIEAYCCIAALLEIGVTADCILFVEPFPSEEDLSMRINCFNNETVDERVQEKLAALGITIYRKCFLYDWCTKESRVESLWLRTPMQMQNIPCFALFYYGIKGINLNTFKAITECGLVYNDGLVVGTMFESNDPNVYAAGSCTRYSRRLRTNIHHRNYSSEDVGEALAKIFLNRLDPFLSDNHSIDTDSVACKVHPYSSSLLTRWQPVMKFESPIVLSATLPGPLYYMTLRKPGLEVPNAVQLLLPNQGHSLVTNKAGNYFHLQLNSSHRVESLCCLSNKQFPNEAFAQLYRRHEACFNNLLYRFQANMIDDLYEYFTQPWITALYQEPIDKLFEDIDEQGGYKVTQMHPASTTGGEPQERLLGLRHLTNQNETRQKCHFTLVLCEGEVPPRACRPIQLLTIRQTAWHYFFVKFTELHKDGETVSEIETNLVGSAKECGQNEQLRHNAAVFWKEIDGENIVYTNLAKYLLQNSVCNPYYAIPGPSRL